MVPNDDSDMDTVTRATCGSGVNASNNRVSLMPLVECSVQYCAYIFTSCVQRCAGRERRNVGTNVSVVLGNDILSVNRPLVPSTRCCGVVHNLPKTHTHPDHASHCE